MNGAEDGHACFTLLNDINWKYYWPPICIVTPNKYHKTRALVGFNGEGAVASYIIPYLFMQRLIQCQSTFSSLIIYCYFKWTAHVSVTNLTCFLNYFASQPKIGE